MQLEQTAIRLFVCYRVDWCGCSDNWCYCKERQYHWRFHDLNASIEVAAASTEGVDTSKLAVEEMNRFALELDGMTALTRRLKKD